MQVSIQSIRVKDHYNTISQLMRGLHEHEQLLFDKTDDWDSIEVNYMRYVMDMQEQQHGTCLLAYVDELPAGFIFGYEDEEDDSRIEAYAGKDLYVSDGYVEPAYRRLGIYRQMNEQLESIYIKRGVRRILRYTLTSNARMQEFLAAHDYQPVRLLYEKWLTPDGKGTVPLRLSSNRDEVAPKKGA